MVRKTAKRHLEDEGKECPNCGEIRRRTKIHCEGRKKRNQPMLEFLACRCYHPGDYLCNCGNPCFSFF